MKTLKITAAIILILGIMFSFAGCGDKKAEESIVGTWVWEVDFAEILDDQFGLDIDEDGYVYLVFDFDKNGKVEMTLDEDKSKDGMEDYIDALVDFAVDATYEELEAYGYSKSAADEEVMLSYGMDMEEYVISEVFGYDDADEMLEDMVKEMDTSKKSYYKLDGNKLYMEEDKDDLEDSRDYIEIELDGDELRFVDASDRDFEDMAEELGQELPIVLERD